MLIVPVVIFGLLAATFIIYGYRTIRRGGTPAIALGGILLALGLGATSLTVHASVTYSQLAA